MKHKIISTIMVGCMLLGTVFAASGCSFPGTGRKAATEPVYYLSEKELPEDAYYIVRTETVKKKTLTGGEEEVEETRYYPLYQAENTIDSVNDTYKGYDPTRITWVNADIDEALVPTMYAEDKMIYKSSKSIPTTYALEKFFDDGYTLGVMGLAQDLSGNYRYYGPNESTQTSFTMGKSDATGFDDLKGVDTIYFVQVGDTMVTPENVSLSGTITGLDFEKKYDCDIRQGTKKINATLTCNIHYFSSAETYMFGSFSFITPIIAQINIPNYVTTGYYNLNGGGFYRYVADKKVTSYSDLKASDYNKTIYTYDEDGDVDGTTIGCTFDENGFLVKGTSKNSTYTGKKSGLTYDALINESKEDESLSNTTELESENGVYSGTYRIDSLEGPTILDSKSTYTVIATNTDNNEMLDMQYVKTASKIELKEGTTYTITFKKSTNGFDGYEILTAKEVTK